MTNFFTQKNKSFSAGFTLIETMVAIFILTVAMGSLLSVTASSFYASRYAKNEMTVTYLLQEPIDYIRNDRDTIAFQATDNTTATEGGWEAFLVKYGYVEGGQGAFCFSSNGCYFEPADVADPLFLKDCGSSNPATGASGCPFLNYDEEGVHNGYYTYKTAGGLSPSLFRRRILLSANPNNISEDGVPEEVDIRVIIEWTNGTLLKTRTLEASLLNWQSSTAATAGDGLGGGGTGGGGTGGGTGTGGGGTGPGPGDDSNGGGGVGSGDGGGSGGGGGEPSGGGDSGPGAQ